MAKEHDESHVRPKDPREIVSPEDAAGAILEGIFAGGDRVQPDTGDDDEDEGRQAPPESDPDEDEDVEEIDFDDEADLDDAEDEVEADDEVEFDEDDEDFDEEIEESLLTVMIDGEEQQITPEEAAKGYQRQSDYTRKTQELAERRRQMAEEFESIQAERMALSRKLQIAEQVVEGSMPKEPDWAALKASNPQKYAAERLEWQEQQQKLQAIRAEQQNLQHQMSQAAEQRKAELRANMGQKLLEAVPEWAEDQQTAYSELTDLENFAIDQYGFEPEMFSEVYDHRAILLLRDAKRLHDLQSEGDAAVKTKGKKKVKTLKPGGKKGSTRKRKASSATKKIRKAGERLNKTGAKDAAVDILSTAFEDMLS